MSEQLYKAIIRSNLQPTASLIIGQWAAQVLFSPGTIIAPRINTLVDNWLDVELATMRKSKHRDAKEQLGKKADHLLNVYVDCDRATYDVTITYVFNNNDTALMFKLATQ